MTVNGVQKSPTSTANIFIQPAITSLFKITHLQLKALNADVGL